MKMTFVYPLLLGGLLLAGLPVLLHFLARQKPKTLVIEHNQRPGYKLLNQKPAETTTNAYRFEVKLGPDSNEKFPVTEERVYDNTTTVSSLTPDVLLTYVQNKAISETGRRQLQQIVDLKRQIADLDGRIRHLQRKSA